MAKKELPVLLPRKLVLWMIFTVIITAFCGLVYVAVQQDMRQGANDPQIQMAEDMSTFLNAGQAITPSGTLDISKSLVAFYILYNTQGQPTSSTVQLNGKIPQIPSGVFTYVKSQGEDRFTWQPEVGVRIAAVVVPYNNGYVLAGRSLREVEKREDKLMLQVAGVWVAAVGIISVLSVLL